MATLPDIKPDNVNSSKKVKARVLKSQFGDGYAQRVADGLNNVVETWTLKWSNITLAEKDELEAHFEDHAGYLSFDWIVPGESTSKKFVCDEWGVTPKNSQYFNMTAKLQQEFDLQ